MIVEQKIRKKFYASVVVSAILANYTGWMI